MIIMDRCEVGGGGELPSPSSMPSNFSGCDSPPASKKFRFSSSPSVLRNGDGSKSAINLRTSIGPSSSQNDPFQFSFNNNKSNDEKDQLCTSDALDVFSSSQNDANKKEDENKESTSPMMCADEKPSEAVTKRSTPDGSTPSAIHPFGDLFRLIGSGAPMASRGGSPLLAGSPPPHSNNSASSPTPCKAQKHAPNATQQQQQPLMDFSLAMSLFQQASNNFLGNQSGNHQLSNQLFSSNHLFQKSQQSFNNSLLNNGNHLMNHHHQQRPNHLSTSASSASSPRPQHHSHHHHQHHHQHKKASAVASMAAGLLNSNGIAGTPGSNSSARSVSSSHSSRQTTPGRGTGDGGPPPIVIPGALAVAASPAAHLFSEDDWSWHRNPAASIRSGGTNKQTPVWKYFVYNKTENLSRCIVGTCTYMLKGPHTSTLACHLKKHPVEYNEFQQLKVYFTFCPIRPFDIPSVNKQIFQMEYTRERNAGQLSGGGSNPSNGKYSVNVGKSNDFYGNNNNNNNNNNCGASPLSVVSSSSCGGNGNNSAPPSMIGNPNISGGFVSGLPTSTIATTLPLDSTSSAAAARLNIGNGGNFLAAYAVAAAAAAAAASANVRNNESAESPNAQQLRPNYGIFGNGTMTNNANRTPNDFAAAMVAAAALNNAGGSKTKNEEHNNNDEDNNNDANSEYNHQNHDGAQRPTVHNGNSTGKPQMSEILSLLNARAQAAAAAAACATSSSTGTMEVASNEDNNSGDESTKSTRNSPQSGPSDDYELNASSESNIFGSALKFSENTERSLKYSHSVMLPETSTLNVKSNESRKKSLSPPSFRSTFESRAAQQTQAYDTKEITPEPTANAMPPKLVFPSSLLNNNIIGLNTKNSNGLCEAQQVAPTSLKKWPRQDRRQRELEVKLALAMAAADVPLAAVTQNPLLRDLFESAQPKFTIPVQLAHLEEIANIQQNRHVCALKLHLAATQRVSLLVDILTASDDNNIQNDAIRIVVVNATFYSPATHRVETALLGVRRVLPEDENNSNALQRTINSILYLHDLEPKRVSRIVVMHHNMIIDEMGRKAMWQVSSGANKKSKSNIHRQDAFGALLAQSVENVFATNETIQQLQETFCDMIAGFCKSRLRVKRLAEIRSEPPALLNRLFRRCMTKGLTSQQQLNAFLAAAQYVLSAKDAFMLVYSFATPNEQHIHDAGKAQMLTDYQWKMLSEAVEILTRFDGFIHAFSAQSSFISQGTMLVDNGTPNEQSLMNNDLPDKLGKRKRQLPKWRPEVLLTADKVIPLINALHTSMDDFSALSEVAIALRDDIAKRFAFVTDVCSAEFDDAFALATATNPQLLSHLDVHQIDYAKSKLQRMLADRLDESMSGMNVNHLASTGKNGAIGVDALLAAAIKRKASAATVLNNNNNNNCRDNDLLFLLNENNNQLEECRMRNNNNEDEMEVIVEECDQIKTLADDSAVDKATMKEIQSRKNCGKRNAEAEAIVEAYFEEVVNGGGYDIYDSYGVPSDTVAEQQVFVFWEQYAAAKNTAEFATLAQQLLVVPANTLSLERVFTDAGDVSRRLEDAYRGMHFYANKDEELKSECLEELDQFFALIERNALLRLNRHFMPKMC